jgi:light-independent protochlorophyllide reductase subunit N
VASQLSLKLRRQSTKVLCWLPPQRYNNLPSLSDGVYVCGVNPFLSRTTTTLMQHHKCKLIQTPFPIGLDGKRVWIEKNCSIFGIKTQGLEER